MKHYIFAAAFILASGAAVAGQEHQPSPSPSTAGTSSSVSGAAALSASRSQATAASASRATGGRSNATGGASNVTVNNTGGGSGGYGGGYTARGNTPDVVLPAISGGNPCGLGAGVGGSGPGAGGLLSFMWSDKSCERRQTAAIMANMGRGDVAVEVLCADMDFRNAMAQAATPCEIDRQRFVKDGWVKTPAGWVKR